MQRLPLLLLLLVVGGCAHQPSFSPTSVAIEVPPIPSPSPPVASDSPASQATAPTPSPIESDVAEADSGMADHGPDRASAGPDAMPGPPADSLVTAKPADLLERLRSGFKLEEVDEPAVDAQLNWFANHPDFLERTFGRAELWLYYIVGQLERGNMPSRARAAAGHRERLRALCLLPRQRLGAVAIRLRHRPPLRPQAGLVVRRQARPDRGDARRARLPAGPAR